MRVWFHGGSAPTPISNSFGSIYCTSYTKDGFNPRESQLNLNLQSPKMNRHVRFGLNHSLPVASTDRPESQVHGQDTARLPPLIRLINSSPGFSLESLKLAWPWHGLTFNLTFILTTNCMNKFNFKFTYLKILSYR